MLQPGRAARWTVAEGTVTLDFDPGAPGPGGAELVDTWPSLDEPPWLGHRVERITVLPGDRVRVEFSGPASDPARLFADPRLAGRVRPPGDGDVRDAIDGAEADIVTRHDASIEYARSLGRPTRLVAFDRLYVVAFHGTAGAAGEGDLAAAIGEDWIGWGAAGARRLPSVSWQAVVARCAPGAVAIGGGSSSRPPGSADPARPTVSYPDGDLPARQIAERLASAGLRTGPRAAVVSRLTGSRGRLAVRAAAGEAAGPARSDMAAVVRVHAGPVHPCSLYGEARLKLAGWHAEGGALLLIGEVGAFAIGDPAGRGP